MFPSTSMLVVDYPTKIPTDDHEKVLDRYNCYYGFYCPRDFPNSRSIESYGQDSMLLVTELVSTFERSKEIEKNETGDYFDYVYVGLVKG